ncbi:MAG: hypothetical protein JWR04_1506 [Rhodoglobus sp.]|nr:hypothetical protein [Rhodoglobus sp.]
MTLFIGTYTEPHPHVLGRAGGIVVADYDGAIRDPRTVAVRSPSWLALSPAGTHVYSVIEAGSGEPGQVAVFSRHGGSLLLEQVVASGGYEPAHLAVDPSGRFLVVANYADGSLAVFALRADGLLGRMTHLVSHVGSSVHPVRQAGPHPHQAYFDPVTGRMLVPDLGTDALVGYSLDGEGRLTEEDRVALPPGSGPRHAVLHSDGEHLFVVNELASTIAVLVRTGASFAVESVVSTVPADAEGPTFASAIAVARDGRTVYAGNRGHDSIAVFSWDGALEPLQFEPTRGRTPRDFTLSPDESLLHVANQDSDTVVTFARNGHGRLAFRDEAPVPTPVCLVIAED